MYICGVFQLKTLLFYIHTYTYTHKYMHNLGRLKKKNISLGFK